MNELYYIKIGKIYLCYMTFDSKAVDNCFIDSIKFSIVKYGSSTFKKEEANEVIKVLVNIGFNKEDFEIEKVE